jgi:hypothetical protein
MPNIPGSELAPPAATSEPPRHDILPAPDYPADRLHTLMITDYDLAEDDPNRFTAVLVTPKQLEEMAQADPTQFVQYTQWGEEGPITSVMLSEADAKPLYLAATSSLRGAGTSESQAIRRALGQCVSQLGTIAVAIDRPMRLQ